VKQLNSVSPEDKNKALQDAATPSRLHVFQLLLKQDVPPTTGAFVTSTIGAFVTGVVGAWVDTMGAGVVSTGADDTGAVTGALEIGVVGPELLMEISEHCQ